MLKEEFIELQHRHQESGKTLKGFLVGIGVGYSTYNYWRKKFVCAEEPHELAPISFRTGSDQTTAALSFPKNLPAGATLLFPNGLRGDFGTGPESMLMVLSEKSLVSHVLSK